MQDQEFGTHEHEITSASAARRVVTMADGRIVYGERCLTDCAERHTAHAFERLCDCGVWLDERTAWRPLFCGICGRAFEAGAETIEANGRRIHRGTCRTRILGAEPAENSGTWDGFSVGSDSDW